MAKQEDFTTLLTDTVCQQRGFTNTPLEIIFNQ